MSEQNGNGNGKTAAISAGRPFKPGFDPRRGHGKKGRSGRPRSEVRGLLVDEFMALIPRLKRDVKDGKLEPVKFADLCAKYGLGTTVTETDTEGNDVIRIVRERRLPLEHG